MVRVPKAKLGSWLGPEMSDGQVQFSQAIPQGPTTINVSLTNLGSIAGGYHVHILPLKPGSVEPCSNANIQGHYNPLRWNLSNSPAPGNGTVDQYEIGDISGKFGLLTNQNNFDAVYLDPNMPMTGPYSIVRRSIVVHYTNGSRDRLKRGNYDARTKCITIGGSPNSAPFHLVCCLCRSDVETLSLHCTCTQNWEISYLVVKLMK
uniref:Superoxide dismutase copper/zinc binding domain-containing protein n=1 Tax=Amphiprion percula TaxID=161767 RepID=A0A3P8S8V0_AMPPE